MAFYRLFYCVITIVVQRQRILTKPVASVWIMATKLEMRKYIEYTRGVPRYADCEVYEAYYVCNSIHIKFLMVY